MLVVCILGFCFNGVLFLYTVFHKKELPIFVRRKQTSRCKIVKLGSFTGF